MELAIAWKAPLGAQAVSFVFAILALVLDWVAAHQSGLDAEISAISAFVLAFFSVATEWYSNRGQASGVSAPLKALDGVIAISDTIALIAGGAVLFYQLS